MRFALVVLAALLFAGGPAQASADPVFTFDGEHFDKAFASTQPSEQFVEFTRPNETVEDWTKLLVLHWFRNDPRKPEDASAALARLAERQNSGADAVLTGTAGASEAIVHFMAKAPDSNVVEVDVFKYAPAAEGRGLVAAQFSFRFEMGAADPATVRAARLRAVEEMKHFDMGQVRAFFASLGP